MLRRPRIHLDNVPLCIVQRARKRLPCFFGELDYLVYLHWLGAVFKNEHLGPREVAHVLP